MKHFLVAALLVTTAPAFGQGMPAPEGAEVYFIGLEDGASVASPVTVRFGLSGMGVAPAGTDAENTGHHHLLLNRPRLARGRTRRRNSCTVCPPMTTTAISARARRR